MSIKQYLKRHGGREERVLLGQVLRGEKTLRDIEGQLILHPINQTILLAMIMIDAAGDPIDLITLAQKLNEQDKLKEVGGAVYLVCLADEE